MKIGKFVALMKRRGYGAWINSSNQQEVYLTTGASIYKAPGLPFVDDMEVAKAILDIDKKIEEKVTLEIKEVPGMSDIFGCDLSDGSTKAEYKAEHIRAAAVIDDAVYSVLRTEDNGEILFYDRILLAPLADKLKDKDAAAYINYAVRRHARNNEPYIVVKDGFQTLAAILPVHILTTDYISELQDFQLMCIDQLRREKDREAYREQLRQQEEGQQETLPETMEASEPEKSEEELQELADRACELDNLQDLEEDEEDDLDDLEE